MKFWGRDVERIPIENIYSGRDGPGDPVTDIEGEERFLPKRQMRSSLTQSKVNGVSFRYGQV